jgi:hypothetical protein
MADLIATILTFVFRAALFLFKVVWWLGVFVVLSAGAGIVWLTRIGRPRPDFSVGSGAFAEDGAEWRDEKTGQFYPVDPANKDVCEIRVDEAGVYWRTTALMRLIGRGVMLRHKFVAVDRTTSAVVTDAEFGREARRNITVEHLDPEKAGSDPYDLRQDRQRALEALDFLDLLLEQRGWSRAAGAAGPWYSRVYTRPVIDWTHPSPDGVQHSDHGP